MVHGYWAPFMLAGENQNDYCLLPLTHGYLHLAKGIQKMLSPCGFRHLSKARKVGEYEAFFDTNGWRKDNFMICFTFAGTLAPIDALP